MQTYEYLCQACGHPFEVQATVREYSKGLKPRCPHCGAQKAIRTFTSVNVLRSGMQAGRSGACCGPNCACS